MPAELTLLTAPDCHLCAHAREVLGELSDENGVTWAEVSTESAAGRALASGAPPLRPVLFAAHGRVIAYGRLSLRRLRRSVPVDLDLHKAMTPARPKP